MTIKKRIYVLNIRFYNTNLDFYRLKLSLFEYYCLNIIMIKIKYETKKFHYFIILHIASYIEN